MGSIRVGTCTVRTPKVRFVQYKNDIREKRVKFRLIYCVLRFFQVWSTIARLEQFEWWSRDSNAAKYKQWPQ